VASSRRREVSMASGKNRKTGSWRLEVGTSFVSFGRAVLAVGKVAVGKWSTLSEPGPSRE